MQGRGGELARRAVQEVVHVLRSAGIPFVERDEDSVRRGQFLPDGPIGGSERHGGSSWQSFVRATGSIETDYLNGEIVLLGRIHGIPTPVNTYLQQLANRLATQRRPAGSVPIEEIAARLDLGGVLG